MTRKNIFIHQNQYTCNVTNTRFPWIFKLKHKRLCPTGVDKLCKDQRVNTLVYICSLSQIVFFFKQPLKRALKDQAMGPFLPQLECSGQRLLAKFHLTQMIPCTDSVGSNRFEKRVNMETEKTAERLNANIPWTPHTYPKCSSKELIWREIFKKVFSYLVTWLKDKFFTTTRANTKAQTKQHLLITTH